MQHIITAVLVSLTFPWAAVHAAQIVNVNANANDIPNPVFISLEAGTYSVTPIGIADGGVYDSWSNWSSTTCTLSTGCPLTTPTSFTGWRSAYDVISLDIDTVSVDGTTLTPVDTQPQGNDFARDYFLMNSAIVRYHADDQAVYPDALAALSNSRISMFTLAASGLVGFSINDIRPLGDNRGGISLQISTVPLPPAILLFAFSLAGLATARGKLFVSLAKLPGSMCRWLRGYSKN